MKTITIMPDFGNAPYAWVKDASDTTSYVGLNEAGYLQKPEQFQIDDALHDSFVAWCSEFEQGSDNRKFDWVKFHEQGISLAKQLKLSVSDDFKVIYVKPVEDPGAKDSSQIEV